MEDPTTPASTRPRTWIAPGLEVEHLDDGRLRLRQDGVDLGAATPEQWLAAVRHR